MSNSQSKLGFWSATSLVIGTVVGAGIFMLPAVIASYGGIGIVGWMVSGVGALFLAITFSRLSRMFPKIGGPYAYSRQAYGDVIGFQVAASYWIRGMISVSAIGLVGISYLSTFFPVLQEFPMLRTLVAVGLIWLLTFVNLMGIKPVGVFQIVTSVVKILPLLFMSTVGIFFIQTSHFMPFNISGKPNFEAIIITAAVTFFSLMGMESATIPSDDVESPEKTIPRATMFGTCAAILLYILSAIAILGAVPLDLLALSSAPFGLAMERIVGPEMAPFFGSAVVFCAIVSCIGAMNGYLLLQGKMPVAAAQDHLFPRIFLKENARGAPWCGLISCAVGSSALLLLTIQPGVAQQFEKIVLMASFLGLFVYAYSSMAELVVMLTGKEPFLPKNLWKLVGITLVTFSFCIGAMMGAGSQIALMAVIFMFFSLPAYAWMCWKANHTNA